MRTIRIGSRDSRLAVIQAEMVMAAIGKHHPDIKLELITMKTTGDIILDKTLDKIGGKGLFVKELDRALLNEEVDITVHSFKDMPMETDPRLPIVAVSARETASDVVVFPLGCDEIDLTKPIGCSSARRSLYLKRIYPGCTILPIRGNVQTRLKRLDSGEFSATTLAYAGLKRLDLLSRVSRVFTPAEMLPASCQGVLAVQARADLDVDFLKEFHDETTYQISLAERSFTATLEGGCSSPVAAYGYVEGADLVLSGLYVAPSGEEIEGSITGKLQDSQHLGMTLAKRLREGHIHEGR